jgi:hypothetical protein
MTVLRPFLRKCDVKSLRGARPGLSFEAGRHGMAWADGPEESRFRPKQQGGVPNVPANAPKSKRTLNCDAWGQARDTSVRSGRAGADNSR